MRVPCASSNALCRPVFLTWQPDNHHLVALSASDFVVNEIDVLGNVLTLDDDQVASLIDSPTGACEP